LPLEKRARWLLYVDTGEMTMSTRRNVLPGAASHPRHPPVMTDPPAANYACGGVRTPPQAQSER
jgi:hypothetical protein